MTEKDFGFKPAVIILALFVVAAFLVACATTKVEDQIGAACQTYAGVLSTLAMERAAGGLSDEQVATVEGMRALANPICLDSKWDDPNAALATIEQTLFKLQQMRRQ